jgi:hypothetical protein
MELEAEIENLKKAQEKQAPEGIRIAWENNTIHTMRRG